MPHALTDADHWDHYWREQVRKLPVEMERERGHSLQINAILDLFDRFIEAGSGGNVLEVGGSPGGYLAYLHRRSGCACSILDFSPVGCQLARENFVQLKIPAAVYERDLFDPGLEIGGFDLVYSLGFCEHFDDLVGAVRAHMRLVRPDGLLIIGIPNFRGINGWMAKRLGPQRLASHNLETMSLHAWDRFERDLGLNRLFRGYIGGFEPLMFASWEEGRPRRYWPLKAAATVLSRTLATHGAALRRFNHPLVSGYLMGVWRTAT